MIPTVLFFVLGFLVAAALALASAPLLWKRADRLARKKIEASLPLTREELQGEIDAVNAEHAMAMRRLEMKAQAIKRKAAQDLVEINTLREEVRTLQEQCAEGANLAERLAEKEEEIRRLAAVHGETEEKLARQVAQVEELSRLYEEASLTASSRQIELVARESEIEDLNETLSILRSQRKEADRAMREAVSERTSAENALEIERSRAEELDRRVERLMSKVSTYEDRLERQQGEIMRLKQKIRQNGADRPDVEIPTDTEHARAGPERRDADLSQQISMLMAGGAMESEDSEHPSSPKSEVERLRSRLAALVRENKKLRVELAASTSSTAEEGDEALRERISNLAAEVVNMAATLEGPDSPIHKTLSDAPADGVGGQSPSLAERVRALRESSTTG